jgi:hypothetical protein
MKDIIKENGLEVMMTSARYVMGKLVQSCLTSSLLVSKHDRTSKLMNIAPK